MRKLLLAMFLLLSSGLAFAAGSWGTATVTNNYGETMIIVTYSWTGDAADGTVPSNAMTAAVSGRVFGLYLVQVETNPGSVAPTAGYDIVVNDADGLDVMGGALADRSATATEVAFPGVTGRPNDGALTLVISGQSVVSATGTIKLYFSKTPSAGTVSGTMSPAASAVFQTAPWANGTLVSGATGEIVNILPNLVIAGSAGKYLYVTQCLVTNKHATVGTTVFLHDYLNGAVLYTGYAAAVGGGFSLTFPAPLKVPTAGNGLSITCETTGASVYVSCSGFTSAESY